MRHSHLIPAAIVILSAACSTDPVSNLDQVAPGVTPAGYQARMLGVLNDLRSDYANKTQMMESFGRNSATFTTTDSRFITEWLGDGIQIENSSFYASVDWPNQFNVMLQAQGILETLPAAQPTYSAGDIAKWKGMLYTFEALAYINLEVAKDTLGLAVQGPFMPDPAIPAPIVCSRDVWKFIVALLDSGLTQLNIDQSPGLPVSLPSGFAAVAAQASPSTTAGSFAAFNRALAARANLELAYAIARSPGGTPPTPTTSGSPDVTALQRADSALHASAMYNPAALAPPAAGDYNEALAVYHNFSGASGDIPNNVFEGLQTVYILKEAVNDIEPGDKRLAKLALNVGPAGTGYASVASPYTYAVYNSPSSYIPIMRNEELNLYEAQIQLGLGNLAGAVASLNNVRQLVGGLSSVNPTTYTAVRDQILHELRASTIGEPSGDRAAAIRDYALPAQVNTTWGANDTHATVEPLFTTDVQARGGETSYASCP